MKFKFAAQRFLYQPRGVASVDLGHPLAHGFADPRAFFYLYNGATVLYTASAGIPAIVDASGNNNVGKNIGSGSGCYAPSINTEGEGANCPASSGINSGVKPGTTWTEGTIYWAQQPDNAFNAGTLKYMWGSDKLGSSPEFSAQRFTDNKVYVGWNDVGADGRVVVTNTAAWWTSGKINHWAFTWSSGTKARLFNNGTLIGTATLNTTLNSPATTLSCGTRGISSNSFTGQMLYIGVALARHSDALVKMFYDNPYQIFRKQRRVVFSFATSVVTGLSAIGSGSGGSGGGINATAVGSGT
jgi:hypothetical protein